MLAPVVSPASLARAVLAQSHATAQSSTQSGSFQGQSATVASSPSSLLANAAEEMTMMMSESVSKKLTERKGKDRAKNADLAARLELYQKMLEKEAGRQRPVQQSAFLEHCSREQPIPEDKLDAMLQELFSNDGERAAALFELLKNPDLDAASRRLVESKMAAMAETAMAEVNAYIAAMETSESFTDLGLNSDLVDAYREAVLEDFGSLAQIMDRLVQRFGTNKLGDGLDFLYTALGVSLAAVTAASEEALLEMRMRDIRMARRLKQVYLGAFTVLLRLEQEYEHPPGDVTPELLTEKMLALFGKMFVSSGDVSQLMKMFTFRNLLAELLFVQDNFQMVKELPVDTFDTEERRADVVGAYQGVLDDLIQQEEEELGF